MEKPTSFSLNDSLRRWRGHLSCLPAFERDNIDELEAHLRDSTARLQAGGLSGEEAWLIALKRLGYSETLEHEFAKLDALTTPEALSVAAGMSSGQRANTRWKSLIRSLVAVAAGILVTWVISYLTEAKFLANYYESLGRGPAGGSVNPLTNPATIFKDIWTFDLLAALAGGFVAALLAQRIRVLHAVIVGVAVNLLSAVIVPVSAHRWTFMGFVSGIAMVVATFLGAILRDWQSRTWRPKWPTLAALGGFRGFSRRTGVLSVWLMVAAIVVGVAERLYPQLATEWLQPMEIRLIWAAAAGWIAAFSLAFVGRIKSKQAMRPA